MHGYVYNHMIILSHKVIAMAIMCIIADVCVTVSVPPSQSQSRLGRLALASNLLP